MNTTPYTDYDLEKFWSRVRKTESCWEWVAGKSFLGYGLTKMADKMCRTHRVSWIISNGPIPDKLFVLHKCDNPPCVNPDHLFLGTAKDNTLDALKKGRWPCGQDSKISKLKKDQVIEIRRLGSLKTMSSRQIASGFGITDGTVRDILRFKTWKQIRTVPELIC